MPPEPLHYQMPGTGPRVTATIACPACGGTEMAEGQLGNRRFWPTRARPFQMFALFDNGVAMTAYACLSCGVVTDAVDPTALRRSIGRGARKKTGRTR
ncbi:MAG: hypothetical protein JWO31_640 [Phycisphaerales bacterium]|nr:hypothetical protein [Phycisphaerales bacterium]